MNRILKDILFSPDSFSVIDINTLLSEGQITEKDLSAVLGSEISKAVMASGKGSISDIPAGGMYTVSKQSNIVVLWGTRYSGRSTVVASLLSLKGMRLIEPVGSSEMAKAIRSRGKRLREVFQMHDCYQRLPVLCNVGTEVIQARYHKGLRNYNFTFIEASNSQWVEVADLLKSTTRQIHLFCIDCRKNIQTQVRSLKAVISKLNEAKFLGQSAGIYILVTKTDLMNVPKPYLSNAVQTLVTASGASDLWQEVRNECKKADIYNLQPIVYSVGDFILKDFARIDTTDAYRLCNDFIIPKSEHNHWGLVKLLKMGHKKLAYIVVLLVCAVVCALGYLLYNAIPRILPGPLKPYDYENVFLNRVNNELPSKQDYDTATKRYEDLRLDLKVESQLMQQDGKTQVLPVDVYNRCDTKLVNAFAEILNPEVQRFFENNNWAEMHDERIKLSNQLAELIGHKNHLTQGNASRCKEYSGFFSCYSDTIVPLLKMANHCTSIDLSDRIINISNKATAYPYSNDEKLSSELLDSPFNAFRCYTNYIDSLYNVLISKHNRLNSQLNVATSSYYYNSSDKNSIKNSIMAIEDSMSLVKEEANSLRLKIDEYKEKYDDFDEENQELKSLQDSLEIIVDMLTDFLN